MYQDIRKYSARALFLNNWTCRAVLKRAWVNFDACPMHSPCWFVHLTHQYLSASALFFVTIHSQKWIRSSIIIVSQFGRDWHKYYTLLEHVHFKYGPGAFDLENSFRFKLSRSSSQVGNVTCKSTWLPENWFHNKKLMDRISEWLKAQYKTIHMPWNINMKLSWLRDEGIHDINPGDINSGCLLVLGLSFLLKLNQCTFWRFWPWLMVLDRKCYMVLDH